ncbi:NAD(P)-dependent oxidoreductase [Azotobacter chroococcum]
MQPVRGLTGRRLGICGLGAIGLNVAKRAAAFDMEVGYHGRKARPEAPIRISTPSCNWSPGRTCWSCPCGQTPAPTMRSTLLCCRHWARKDF